MKRAELFALRNYRLRHFVQNVNVHLHVLLQYIWKPHFYYRAVQFVPDLNYFVLPLKSTIIPHTN